MKSRSYYILVLCLAVGGLLFSLFLIPSAKEESLMYFHAKRYKDAKEKFEELYHSGDRSLSVTMPMVWLQLHYADEDKAILILEEYIENNPDDKTAIEYLGTLYRDANRPYDYLLNLETLYRLDPKEETLRKQEQLLMQFGKVNERIKILQDLVDQKKASIGEYRDLSYLLAAQGDEKGAKKLADAILYTFPMPDYDAETVNFLIGLYADVNEKKKAAVIAQKFVKTHYDIANIIRVTTYLSRKKMYEEALTILGRLSPDEQNLPVVQGIKTSLYIQSGKKEYAYVLLDEEWNKGTLWKKLYPEYVSLAAEIEPSQSRFREIIDGMQLQDLSADALVMVARRAILTKDPDLVQKLSKNLYVKNIHIDPMLAFVLALGARPEGTKDEEFFRSLYEQGNYNDHQKAIIAELLDLKGYKKFSKEVVSEITSFKDIPEGDWYSLSSLYVRLGLSSTGLQMINEVRDDSRETASDDNSWLLLAVATGKMDEVAEFLKKEENIDAPVLKDIFYVAVEKKRYNYLLGIAKELYQEVPNNESAEFVGAAELLGGDPKKGLGIFEELKESGFEPGELYIFSLNIAAKKNPLLKKILVHEVKEILEKKEVSPSKLREYGFIFADNGYKKEARAVFFNLAEGKSYKDPDMQMLLSLLPKKLSKKDIQWMREQAMLAQGIERIGWLKEFVWRGYPKYLIELGTLEDLKKENALADAYLESANLFKRKDLVKKAAEFLLQGESKIGRLVKIAWETYYADLNEFSESIFERAFTIAPLNPRVLRGLGVISYNMGNLKRAACLLERLMEEFEVDYLVYYTYGELLWRRGEKGFARSYYEKTIEKLDMMKNRGSPYKSVRANALFRLGYYTQAFQIFEELIDKKPHLASLYADYAGLQMDLRNYKEACCILSRYIPKVTNQEPEDPVARKFYYLAWVRYYKETNQIKKGIDLLCTLSLEYPHDVDILSYSADLYFITGNWREAAWFINDALWRRPYNESFWEAQFDVLGEFFPLVGSNYEYRTTGSHQWERFIRAYGTYDIHPRLRVGGLAEVDYIHINPYNDVSNNELINFKGLRERTTLFAEQHLWYGHDIRESIFLGSGGIYGLGAEYNKLWYRDRFLAGFEYHNPYWGFTQTTTNFGSRDTAYIGWYRRFSYLLEGLLIPRINRYNLKEFSNALGTWSANGYLSYRIPSTSPIYDWMGKYAVVNLVYQLDMESKTHSLKRIGFDGIEFEPIPLANREEHTFYIFASKRWPPCFTLEAFFGYLIDRKAIIRRFTPVGGFSLEFLPRRGWNFKMEYKHTTDNQITTETVRSFKIDLRYYY